MTPRKGHLLPDRYAYDYRGSSLIISDYYGDHQRSTEVDQVRPLQDSAAIGRSSLRAAVTAMPSDKAPFRSSPSGNVPRFHQHARQPHGVKQVYRSVGASPPILIDLFRRLTHQPRFTLGHPVDGLGIRRKVRLRLLKWPRYSGVQRCHLRHGPACTHLRGGIHDRTTSQSPSPGTASNPSGRPPPTPAATVVSTRACYRYRASECHACVAPTTSWPDP